MSSIIDKPTKKKKKKGEEPGRKAPARVSPKDLAIQRVGQTRGEMAIDLVVKVTKKLSKNQRTKDKDRIPARVRTESLALTQEFDRTFTTKVENSPEWVATHGNLKVRFPDGFALKLHDDSTALEDRAAAPQHLQDLDPKSSQWLGWSVIPPLNDIGQPFTVADLLDFRQKTFPNYDFSAPVRNQNSKKGKGKGRIPRVAIMVRLQPEKTRTKKDPVLKKAKTRIPKSSGMSVPQSVLDAIPVFQDRGSMNSEDRGELASELEMIVEMYDSMSIDQRDDHSSPEWNDFMEFTAKRFEDGSDGTLRLTYNIAEKTGVITPLMNAQHSIHGLLMRTGDGDMAYKASLAAALGGFFRAQRAANPVNVAEILAYSIQDTRHFLDVVRNNNYSRKDGDMKPDNKQFRKRMSKAMLKILRESPLAFEHFGFLGDSENKAILKLPYFIIEEQMDGYERVEVTNKEGEDTFYWPNPNPASRGWHGIDRASADALFALQDMVFEDPERQAAWDHTLENFYSMLLDLVPSLAIGDEGLGALKRFGTVAAAAKVAEERVRTDRWNIKNIPHAAGEDTTSEAFAQNFMMDPTTVDSVNYSVTEWATDRRAKKGQTEVPYSVISDSYWAEVLSSTMGVPFIQIGLLFNGRKIRTAFKALSAMEGATWMGKPQEAQHRLNVKMRHPDSGKEFGTLQLSSEMGPFGQPHLGNQHFEQADKDGNAEVITPITINPWRQVNANSSPGSPFRDTGGSETMKKGDVDQWSRENLTEEFESAMEDFAIYYSTQFGVDILDTDSQEDFHSCGDDVHGIPRICNEWIEWCYDNGHWDKIWAQAKTKKEKASLDSNLMPTRAMYPPLELDDSVRKEMIKAMADAVSGHMENKSRLYFVPPLAPSMINKTMTDMIMSYLKPVLPSDVTFSQMIGRLEIERAHLPAEMVEALKLDGKAEIWGYKDVDGHYVNTERFWSPASSLYKLNMVNGQADPVMRIMLATDWMRLVNSELPKLPFFTPSLYFFSDNGYYRGDIASFVVPAGRDGVLSSLVNNESHGIFMVDGRALFLLAVLDSRCSGWFKSDEQQTFKRVKYLNSVVPSFGHPNQRGLERANLNTLKDSLTKNDLQKEVVGRGPPTNPPQPGTNCYGPNLTCDFGVGQDLRYVNADIMSVDALEAVFYRGKMAYADQWLFGLFSNIVVQIEDYLENLDETAREILLELGEIHPSLCVDDVDYRKLPPSVLTTDDIPGTLIQDQRHELQKWLLQFTTGPSGSKPHESFDSELATDRFLQPNTDGALAAIIQRRKLFEMIKLHCWFQHSWRLNSVARLAKEKRLINSLGTMLQTGSSKKPFKLGNEATFDKVWSGLRKTRPAIAANLKPIMGSEHDGVDDQKWHLIQMHIKGTLFRMQRMMEPTPDSYLSMTEFAQAGTSSLVFGWGPKKPALSATSKAAASDKQTLRTNGTLLWGVVALCFTGVPISPEGLFAYKPLRPVDHTLPKTSDFESRMVTDVTHGELVDPINTFVSMDGKKFETAHVGPAIRQATWVLTEMLGFQGHARMLQLLASYTASQGAMTVLGGQVLKFCYLITGCPQTKFLNDTVTAVAAHRLAFHLATKISTLLHGLRSSDFVQSTCEGSFPSDVPRSIVSDLYGLSNTWSRTTRGDFTLESMTITSKFATTMPPGTNIPSDFLGSSFIKVPVGVPESIRNPSEAAALTVAGMREALVSGQNVVVDSAQIVPNLDTEGKNQNYAYSQIDNTWDRERDSLNQINLAGGNRTAKALLLTNPQSIAAAKGTDASMRSEAQQKFRESVAYCAKIVSIALSVGLQHMVTPFGDSLYLGSSVPGREVEPVTGLVQAAWAAVRDATKNVLIEITGKDNPRMPKNVANLLVLLGASEDIVDDKAAYQTALSSYTTLFDMPSESMLEGALTQVIENKPPDIINVSKLQLGRVALLVPPVEKAGTVLSQVQNVLQDSPQFYELAELLDTDDPDDLTPDQISQAVDNAVEVMVDRGTSLGRAVRKFTSQYGGNVFQVEGLRDADKVRAMIISGDPHQIIRMYLTPLLSKLRVTVLGTKLRTVHYNARSIAQVLAVQYHPEEVEQYLEVFLQIPPKKRGSSLADYHKLKVIFQRHVLTPLLVADPSLVSVASDSKDGEFKRLRDEALDMAAEDKNQEAQQARSLANRNRKESKARANMAERMLTAKSILESTADLVKTELTMLSYFHSNPNIVGLTMTKALRQLTGWHPELKKSQKSSLKIFVRGTLKTREITAAEMVRTFLIVHCPHAGTEYRLYQDEEDWRNSKTLFPFKLASAVDPFTTTENSLLLSDVIRFNLGLLLDHEASQGAWKAPTPVRLKLSLESAAATIPVLGWLSVKADVLRYSTATDDWQATDELLSGTRLTLQGPAMLEHLIDNVQGTQNLANNPKDPPAGPGVPPTDEKILAHRLREYREAVAVLTSLGTNQDFKDSGSLIVQLLSRAIIATKAPLLWVQDAREEARLAEGDLLDYPVEPVLPILGRGRQSLLPRVNFVLNSPDQLADHDGLLLRNSPYGCIIACLLPTGGVRWRIGTRTDTIAFAVRQGLTSDNLDDLFDESNIMDFIHQTYGHPNLKRQSLALVRTAVVQSQLRAKQDTVGSRNLTTDSTPPTPDTDSRIDERGRSTVRKPSRRKKAKPDND